MKKERIYSTVYGLILVFTLAATSMMGQMAYNTAQPTDVMIDYSEVKSAVIVANVNTTAIATISNHLKTKITDLKERIGISESGTWIVEVTISKLGEIKSTTVSRNDRVGDLIQDIISDISEVEPITYNGVAKEKTIQIPVVLSKR